MRTCWLAQGLAVSYQTAPVVTATSVTYPFVQDLVLGFPGSLTATRELVAFDPLTATMRWTVSKCAGPISEIKVACVHKNGVRGISQSEPSVIHQFFSLSRIYHRQGASVRNL